MKFQSKSLAIQAIKLLEEVKSRLPEQHDPLVSHYICDNISNTSTGWRVQGALKQWIQKLLGGGEFEFSLQTWMNRNVLGLTDYNDALVFWKDEENQRKLQRTRQAWLDWMIQEIEKNNKIKS